VQSLCKAKPRCGTSCPTCYTKLNTSITISITISISLTVSPGAEASTHCTSATDYHHQHQPNGPKLQNTAPVHSGSKTLHLRSRTEAALRTLSNPLSRGGWRSRLSPLAKVSFRCVVFVLNRSRVAANGYNNMALGSHSSASSPKPNAAC